MIAYKSQNLKDHELNYSSHDLKLEAMVYVLV